MDQKKKKHLLIDPENIWIKDELVLTLMFYVITPFTNKNMKSQNQIYNFISYSL